MKRNNRSLSRMAPRRVVFQACPGRVGSTADARLTEPWHTDNRLDHQSGTAHPPLADVAHKGRGRARGAVLLILAGLGLLVTGCPPRAPAPLELLRTIDANNRLVRRMNCTRADLSGRAGILLFVGEANLYYAKPRRLSFAITELGGKPILRVGSNDEQYWVAVSKWMEHESTLWHGKWTELGQVESRRLPLRPDWLIACLGVEDMGNEGWGPFPRTHPWYTGLLFGQRDADSGYGYIVRETRVDHRPGRPIEMRFYDPDGTERMWAELSDFRPLPEKRWAAGQWSEQPPGAASPRVAHRIRLSVKDWGQLTLSLDEMFAPDRQRDDLFRIPDPGGFDNVIRLDPAESRPAGRSGGERQP